MDGSDGGKRASERFEREVAYISKELKKLAKQLGCVIIALAQLNEDARTEKRFPRGEDLSQCKALRHDADKVILINNDSAIERRTQERDDEAEHVELPSEVVQLIVDKNRGGREGMVHVIFRPSHSSFGDMEIAARRAYVEERKRSREQPRDSSPGRGRR
jgi:replicative DNA helicase